MSYKYNYYEATWQQNLWLTWREFWSILHAMNRQAELVRLVEWAGRKRLAGPRRAYQARLSDEERRVLRYTLNYPRLAAWARRVQRLNRLISPAPRYLARGSAAIYSSKRLTYSRKIL
jgi:hypothetical protein